MGERETETGQTRTAGDGNGGDEEAGSLKIARDTRAMWVAVTGIIGIAGVVLLGIWMLPGPIGMGETDNASAAIGGAIGAGVAAIGTVVSAYFGIRAANQTAQAATQTAQAATSTAQETLQTQNESLQTQNQRTQDAFNRLAGTSNASDVEQALNPQQGPGGPGAGQ